MKETDFFEDYYALLKVESTASFVEIERAFGHEIQYWHPDKFASRSFIYQEQAHAMTVRLNNAFDMLKDPVRRKAYDELRTEWLEYLSESDAIGDDELYSESKARMDWDDPKDDDSDFKAESQEPEYALWQDPTGGAENGVDKPASVHFSWLRWILVLPGAAAGAVVGWLGITLLAILVELTTDSQFNLLAIPEVVEVIRMGVAAYAAVLTGAAVAPSHKARAAGGLLLLLVLGMGGYVTLLLLVVLSPEYTIGDWELVASVASIIAGIGAAVAAFVNVSQESEQGLF